MQFKTLEELISNTCSRIAFIDDYKKTPYQELLLSMYDAVKLDFELNLKLLLLTSSTKLEIKQIKYMLKKTKSLRKQSWKLSFEKVANDYRENKIDMYNFSYDKMGDKVSKYKLFDKKQICERRESEHKEKFLIFRRRKRICLEKEENQSTREENIETTIN